MKTLSDLWNQKLILCDRVEKLCQFAIDQGNSGPPLRKMITGCAIGGMQTGRCLHREEKEGSR